MTPTEAADKLIISILENYELHIALDQYAELFS